MKTGGIERACELWSSGHGTGVLGVTTVYIDGWGYIVTFWICKKTELFYAHSLRTIPYSCVEAFVVVHCVISRIS